MKKGFAVWVSLVAALSLGAGCSSGSGGSDGQGQATEISPSTTSCGNLSCNQAQTCLQIQSLSPFSSGPTTYECIPTPAGCGGLELCDCEATEGEVQGKPVTGCSLLGERTLYLTDVTCGDRNCSAAEFCLAEYSSTDFQAAAEKASCQPLTGPCTVDFCGEACTTSVAMAAELTYRGCLEADWARAIGVGNSVQ